MISRLLCLLTLFVFGSDAVATEPRPNILLILADDLGWSDTGCYGNKRFRTPNIDRLAAGGVQFTQAYAAAPICSASRASLLTGNSTARNRFEFVVKREAGRQKLSTPLQTPPFVLDLDLDAVTIPEVLADEGYHTGFFGKWHLNAHHGRYLGWSPTHGPTAQGFATATEDFGSHPYSYWNKGPEGRDFLDLPAGTVPSDGVTDRAVNFLNDAAKSDRPFFLMVSHFYVHDPNHTRIRWLHDRYRDLFADHPRRDRLSHYGAMVTTLDHHVGELLTALDRTGQADSTVVVFTSDNGGHPNYGGNAPLRGSKWNLYEGGIRVPLLIRWPGVVVPGSISDQPVWSPDLLPTFAEIAGGTSPTARDGISLVPGLRDPAAPDSERSMVWHFPYYHPEKRYLASPDSIGIDDGVTSKTRPQSAIRAGDWKLIHFHERGISELYDLSEDPSETTDLSTRSPERTERLQSKLRKYLNRVDARMPTRKEK